MISHNELLHLRMQATIRDHHIPESELKYIGEIDGSHTYLIDESHIVRVEDIIDFEEVDEYTDSDRL